MKEIKNTAYSERKVNVGRFCVPESGRGDPVIGYQSGSWTEVRQKVAYERQTMKIEELDSEMRSAQ